MPPTDAMSETARTFEGEPRVRFAAGSGPSFAWQGLRA
jgi:hypothetical protein